jgi:UDP-galactopyranose mutase
MTSKLACDLVVFSHLRWDFVFQRPQHLLTRCAQHRRVYFVEEPVFEHHIPPRLLIGARSDGVHVVVPHLPIGATEQDIDAQLTTLIEAFLRQRVSSQYVLWYYTPMALKFSRDCTPIAVVYDCMDELSHFKFAPPDLCALEDELFGRADVVFTGGMSLFEYKRAKHSNIHAFPSSVDVVHFRTARSIRTEPSDQVPIPHPRIGYTGVIDERIDLDLLRATAEARPDWHLVMIGPIIKIDPASLPNLPNIHYLGPKQYDELPAYLSRWDVALMPFARNDATRFISPTKTPEYLASGRRVVSTSIRDVARVYGDAGLVRIADAPADFVAAIQESLEEIEGDTRWLARVDAFLAQSSWDSTFAAMWKLIDSACARSRAPRATPLSGLTTRPKAPPPAASVTLPGMRSSA